MKQSNNMFLAAVFMSLIYTVKPTGQEFRGNSWTRLITNPFYSQISLPLVHAQILHQMNPIGPCHWLSSSWFSWINYFNPFCESAPCVHNKQGPSSSSKVTSEGSSTNATKVPNVDKVFDYVLGRVRDLLVSANQKTIVIPDISETFHKLGVRGKFKSWNGSFADLSTIYRTGDIQTQMRPASLRVKFSIGLRDALLKYENYKIKLLNVGPDGSLQMKICNNSLNVDVVVSYNPKIGLSRSCKVHLNQIKLETFDNVEVDMTGLGPFNWALNMVSRWTLGSLQGDIKRDFEKVIQVKLQKVLGYGDLCSYLRMSS